MTGFPDLLLSVFRVIARAMWLSIMHECVLGALGDGGDTKVKQASFLPPESSRDSGEGRQIPVSCQHHMTVNGTGAWKDVVLLGVEKGTLGPAWPGRGRRVQRGRLGKVIPEQSTNEEGRDFG